MLFIKSPHTDRQCLKKIQPAKQRDLPEHTDNVITFTIKRIACGVLATFDKSFVPARTKMWSMATMFIILHFSSNISLVAPGKLNVMCSCGAEIV